MSITEILIAIIFLPPIAVCVIWLMLGDLWLNHIDGKEKMNHGKHQGCYPLVF